MAKGTGLYGNFNGKIGNTIGYKIAQSRNRQNQGVRIYQPSVGNPKTAAQAEQRARVAAVQGTYTMLRNIIDRGNERKPYGYASRVEWLRNAYRSEIFPWYQKGAHIALPVICQLTVGSLNSLSYEVSEDYVIIFANHVQKEDTIDTVSEFSTHIKQAFPFLRDGDQITFVAVGELNMNTVTKVMSIVIDETDETQVNGFDCMEGQITWDCGIGDTCYSIIVSREGAGGRHLRSTEVLRTWSGLEIEPPYDAASKAAAIASYQSAGAANSDWSEDPNI